MTKKKGKEMASEKDKEVEPTHFLVTTISDLISYANARNISLSCAYVEFKDFEKRLRLYDKTWALGLEVSNSDNLPVGYKRIG